MANALLKRIQSDREWPWEEKAREELNETPHTNEESLAAFKGKIVEYSKTHPKFRPQLDDNLLMAFLRTCKFDLQLALASYKKLNKVRLCNPEKIFPVGKGPKDYGKYYDKPVVSLLRQRNPLDGTLVFIYSFRNFDPDEDEIEDVFNAAFHLLMAVVVDPSVQTHGTRFILDYTGVTYSVMKSAIGKMYYMKASQMAQESCPMRFQGIHAINAPGWVVKIINTVFRPFMPKELRKQLHFHNSYEEMHQFISPSILPDIFEGSTGLWEAAWMKEAIFEMHDEIVRESYCGFLDL